jgi:hypothetical protein
VLLLSLGPFLGNPDTSRDISWKIFSRGGQLCDSSKGSTFG